MKKGKLYIISGPSGSGKSTVLREVFRHRRNVFFSVSATTRGPREGEVDGKDYFFISKDEFERMIAADELLEHAQYVSNYYGTPRKAVEAMLCEGKDVVLDIEVQGAGQVKAKMPEAVSFFIMPPSLEELEKRLRGRGTESEEKIRSRLSQAEREIAQSGKYDYIVVNDEVSRAAEEILKTMRKIRRRK